MAVYLKTRGMTENPKTWNALLYQTNLSQNGIAIK